LPGSAARPPIQNLSFSTYGPNNQDAALQALYRRTPDDTYIQSLPTGQVIAVQTRTGNDDPAAHSRSAQDQIRWGHTFTEPMYVCKQ
jgi:serine/threonine-protein kinase/endoribonuclease IRE1